MYILTGKRSVGVGGKIYYRGQKVQDDEYKDLPKRVKSFFEKEPAASKNSDQKNAKSAVPPEASIAKAENTAGPAPQKGEKNHAQRTKK